MFAQNISIFSLKTQKHFNLIYLMHRKIESLLVLLIPNSRSSVWPTTQTSDDMMAKQLPFLAVLTIIA